MKRLVAYILRSAITHLTSVRTGRATPIPVTVENFIRAESDLYFSAVALKEDGFGKFEHHRELSPIDAQTIIRMNRDTLYSAAVFDLEAGPVTVTLPDAWYTLHVAANRSARMNIRLRLSTNRAAHSHSGESRHPLRPRRRADSGRSERTRRT